MFRNIYVALMIAGSTMATGGCTNDGMSRAIAAEPATLDEVVRWVGELALQETDEVINVSPNVSIDSRGRFLIADPREVQIRIYSPTGHLEHHFATKGSGPGGFQNPRIASRMHSGAILAVDYSGKAAVFDSVGGIVLSSGHPSVAPIFDAHILADTLVLLAGFLTGTRPTPLLHLWNPSSNKILRSFFIPPTPPAGLEGEFHMTSAVDIATRGDTIAVLFTRSDTVYLFAQDGEPRGKVPVSFRHAQSLTEKQPKFASREMMLKWTESFSMTSGLYWIPDGSFLIQYFDRVNGELAWRLARFTREGRPLFEIRDTPQLLAATADVDTLYFVKPLSPTPDLWAIATLEQ